MMQDVPFAGRWRGKPPLTRPLCPFPLVARYKGQGPEDQADSFACSPPSKG